MSERWPGGVINKTAPVPSNSTATGTAYGVWTLNQIAYYISQGLWPDVNSDPYFYYNTLLLNGNGTNGAQNNTFLDSSTNNFSITRNGNTTQGSFSPYGNLWSNYFNGSSVLTVANNSAFYLGTNDFTLEAWVNYSYIPTDGNYGAIINKYRAGSGSSDSLTAWQWGVNYSSGNWQMFFAPVSGSTETGISGVISNFTFGTWYHVAVTRQSGSVKLFVNGTQVGSTTSYSSSINTGSGQPVSIGARIYSPYDEYFNGYISNARIVNGTAVYTSNFTPSTTPLTAITNTVLLTCQSNQFKDNSSNNFTVNANGSQQVQRFSPFNPTAPYDTATIGGSGYFNAGDYLNTPTTSNVTFGSNDWTVDFWVYASSYSNSAQGTVWDNRYNSSTGICINVFSGGYVSPGQISINTNTTPAVAAGGNLIAGAWNFVRVVRSSGTIYGYTNGTLAFTYSDGRTYGSPTRIYNGSDWNGGSYSNFTGYISDLRQIAGTALSGSTIPTVPQTNSTSGTQLLLSYTNAGIPDLAMQNNLQTVGSAQVSTSVKKYGTGSLSFNGSTDNIQMPIRPSLQLGTANWTIEGWFYFTSTPSHACPFFDGNTSYSVQFYWDGGTYSTNTLTISDRTANQLQVSFTPTSNTWYYIAAVRNGTTYTIYVNGTSLGSSTNSNNYSATSGIYYLGGDSNGGTWYFPGYIDDFRITNGYARYTTNFTPPTAALPTY